MPRVFRQQYTRPIPPDAVRVTMNNKKGELVPAVRFRGPDGKTITAPITTKGKNAGKLCRVASPTWYGKVKGIPTALCTNKTAAEQMLAQLVREAEQLKALGLSEHVIEATKKPLAEHLVDWEQSLQADIATGNTKAKHVRETVRNARRMIEGCGFVFSSEISESEVKIFLATLRQFGRQVAPFDPTKEWYTRTELATLLRIKPPAVTSLVNRHRLAGEGNGKKRLFPKATAEALHLLRAHGRSIKTTNLYLASVKQFTAWLVREKRMSDNPLANLEGGNVELDRRHDRQTLSEQQLTLILQAALASTHTFRGLTGRDRHHLYLAAMTTGFRAGELACLPPEWFSLDDKPPVVLLPATMTKNQKPVRQPIPAEVAECLSTT